MRRPAALAFALALACVAGLLAPRGAEAQRVLAHDTLSGETAIALTCGFCAGERFGVIFRELPSPARGLEPEDFPLELNGVRIALADADVTGASGSYSCEGAVDGGTVLVDLAVYAGETPPSGSIQALPVDDPWPGETLVWSEVDVPVELSVADTAGSDEYTINFNRLLFEGEGEPAPRIDPPHTYVRVVVTLNAGAVSSAACDDLSLDPPVGFPVRDDDGRIADERSFIYAASVGWLWNESPGVSLDGDWGIRLEVTSLGGPGVDGGVPDDAGAGTDAGTGDETDAGSGGSDAGGSADAGRAGGGGGADGCGCVAPGATGDGGSAGGILAALLLWAARRRRR